MSREPDTVVIELPLDQARRLIRAVRLMGGWPGNPDQTPLEERVVSAIGYLNGLVDASSEFRGWNDEEGM